MRKRLGGGAAVALSLAVVLAGCSSSKKADPGNTVPPESISVATTIPGTPTTAKGSHPTTTQTGTTTPGDTTVPTTVGGTVTTSPPPPPTTTTLQSVGVTLWKLALDFRTNPSENPFPSYLGGTKVWSLREGDSLSRDGNYSLLPTYSASFGSSGVAAWHGNTPVCGGLPVAGVDTTPAPLPVCTATIPAGAAFVQPDSSHLAVVAWTSPITGGVTVTGGVADLDGSCGNGVVFFLDRGTTNLETLEIANNNALALNPVNTRVTAGQSLYFIVAPGANHDATCDATQLQMTVQRNS
jgi:hypothetical protein